MSRVLPLVLLLTACGSSNECADEGAFRCSDDGHAVRECRRTTNGALAWDTQPCADRTPTCLEAGPTRAVCVAERLGECDPEEFTDSCVDATTLEDCVGLAAGQPGARHRVRCPAGEVCSEVLADAVGEGRPSGATHACHAPRDASSPPALVTFVHGDVLLGAEPAPAVPFRVPSGTPLRLLEGARAVVLVKERASRLVGPREVDVYELQPEAVTPSPWAAALEEILRRDAPGAAPREEPLLAPAPTAPQEIDLVVGEGLPGASNTLGVIEWACERECGRTVQLRNEGANADVLWRATGDRRVRYDGPALEPGRTYELSLGERAYHVRTAAAPSLRPLLASMSDWPLVEQMSVIAAIHRWSGSRAAAVAALQRTHIERHRVDVDVRALLSAYGAVPTTP